MPRLKQTLPKYSHHRGSGQAYVTLNGHAVYLGPYGSQRSRAQYDRVVAEWLASGRRLPAELLPDSQRDDIRVVELIDRYLEHAEQYYRRPDGKLTSEYNTILNAVKPLNQLYGDFPACEMGPLALKAVRQSMVGLGWCRSHINKQISRIRQIFKWGTENELVPIQIYQSLATVAGLKKGRTTVRESEPVKSIPQEYVDAVLPYVSSQVAALIQLQLLTAMRPGEAVIMRGCDLDTSGSVWVYTPQHHKTEHHGKARKIFIGPRAQRIVWPFLNRDLSAYLFSSKEAEAQLKARRSLRRVTPKSCGNRAGTNRNGSRAKKLGDHYLVASYRRAIERACGQAFPLPDHLARQRVQGRGRKRNTTRWETVEEWKQRLGDEKWQTCLDWQREHRWHPHQLRHNAATFLRKEFGIEAARVVLGHSSAAITEIYAELDSMKAADIMGKIG